MRADWSGFDSCVISAYYSKVFCYLNLNWNRISNMYYGILYRGIVMVWVNGSLVYENAGNFLTFEKLKFKKTNENKVCLLKVPNQLVVKIEKWKMGKRTKNQQKVSSEKLMKYRTSNRKIGKSRKKKRNLKKSKKNPKSQKETNEKDETKPKKPNQMRIAKNDDIFQTTCRRPIATCHSLVFGCFLFFWSDFVL